MLLWLALAVAEPQSAVVEPPKQPDIIVEAPGKRAIESFVEQFGNLGRSRQLARWETGICPWIIGLSAGETSFLNSRLNDLARSVFLQPSYKGCVPTTLIVFTDEAGALATAFAKYYPVSFRQEGRFMLEAFASNNRPVRWISLTDIDTGDGASLLTAHRTHATIKAEIIIVDARQIEGVSIGQISDFVSLVALTNPRPAAHAPRWSILSLFDSSAAGAPPSGATKFDLSYLKEFCTVPAFASGRTEESHITRSMQKERR